MGIDILTLAAARAGKGGGSASKYSQPDWGSETAIVEILPNTELSIMSADEPMAVIMEKVELVDGNVYTVTYNGTAYDCTAINIGDEATVLGNLAVEGGEDTGEPFFLGFYSDEASEGMGGIPGLIIPLDGSETFTLSIKGEGEVIHTIPTKYTGNTMRVTVAHDKTADKTYEEIETAIENGVIVQVFFDAFNNLPENGYTVYNLCQFVKGTGILFYNGSFKQLLTVKRDGTIDVSLAD